MRSWAPRVCGNRRIQCCFIVTVATVICVTTFSNVIVSNITQVDYPLIERRDSGLPKSPRSVSIQNTTQVDSTLIERRDSGLPQSLRLATNAGFFPCDWNAARIPSLQNRASASLVCNETSSAIVFSTTAVRTLPQRVLSNDACLDRVIRTHCYDHGLKVPRVLHYVNINKRVFPFFWFVSVLSAVRFFRPCLILFHGDYLPIGFYWKTLLQFVPHVIHVKRDVPTSIFGNRINTIQHRSDIIRLEALMKHGGLYLDADQWVLRSLDDLRRFPVTLGVEINGSSICSAMILAEPHAAFIQRWYESYHTFHDHQWVEQSGGIPYSLALKFPKEVHLDHSFFTPAYPDMRPLYEGKYDWRNNHGVHLYHRLNLTLFDGDFQAKNTSLGEITRHILFGSSSACQGSESPQRIRWYR